MKIADCVNETCLESGFHIRASFFPFGPWGVIRGRNKNGFVFDGVLYRILQALGSSMNFKFDVRIPPDRQWGSRMPNGTWTGFIGHLQRKEVDLILGPFMMDEERNMDVRFTSDFATASVVIIASVGKSGPNSFYSFLFTFDTLIWYLIMVLFAVTILVSAASESYGHNGTYRFPQRLQHFFWTYLASIFCEGSFRTPSTQSGKLLLGVWLIGILVLMNGFSGQFKAVLSVQNEEDRLYTVKDLAGKPHIAAGLPQATIFELVFKNSPLLEYQQIYKNAVQKKTIYHPRYLTTIECHQRLKNGEVAIIAEENSLKYAISQNCQKLNGTRRMYLVDETFYPCQFTFGVGFDMPLFLVSIMNKSTFRSVARGSVPSPDITKVCKVDETDLHSSDNAMPRTLS